MSIHSHSTGGVESVGVSRTDIADISHALASRYIWAAQVQGKIADIATQCYTLFQAEKAVEDIAAACHDHYTYFYLQNETDTPDTVTSAIVPAGTNRYVSYIKLPSFYQGAAVDVLSALQNIQVVYEAIVLDLRGNTGGYVAEAEALIRLFSSSALYYVRTAQTLCKDPTAVVFKGVVYDQNTPLFILVDKKTSSSSNITAATLKNANRATLVGEQTHEKSFVQTIVGIGKTIVRLRFTTHQVFTSTTYNYRSVGSLQPDYSHRDVLHGSGTKNRSFNAAYKKLHSRDW